ncbi:MAG: hypothetical protein ACJ75B_21515 [Flavisolibacter sp.]
MANKNIVIAPCGNRAHLFKDRWLQFKEEKEFDLCLLFYHEQINNPSLYQEVDYFFHLKDFKYHMLYNLFTNVKPEWLQQYEYFYFLDDDIEINTREINSIFLLSRAFQSSISQAALTHDSFCSWKMFRQQKNSFCRFVGQIEVMAPLFHRDALIKCLPSFVGNRSSWGVDSVWSKILDYPKDKLIVFDTVLMRHTQPVGGGELYQKIGIDPHEDWNAVVKKFNAKKHNYQEYGRLQLVNDRSNRVKFLYYKLGESLARIRQSWRNYDLPSRIESKKNKWLKKTATHS